MANSTVIEEKSQDLVYVDMSEPYFDFMNTYIKYISVAIYDIIAYNISDLHICKR
jgi:hypothetical protein